jgi:hypothetical protein
MVFLIAAQKDILLSYDAFPSLQSFQLTMGLLGRQPHCKWRNTCSDNFKVKTEDCPQFCPESLLGLAL